MKTALKTMVEFTQITSRTWSVAGMAEGEHTLRLLARSLTCTCMTAKREKHCPHTDRLADIFKEELNTCLTPFLPP